MTHADFEAIESLLAAQKPLWPDSHNFVWHDLICQFITRNKNGQKSYFGFCTPKITDIDDEDAEEAKNDMNDDPFVFPTTEGRFNVKFPVPFQSIASMFV